MRWGTELLLCVLLNVWQVSYAAEALAPQTLERLLLIDAARAGSRIVAVGAHGYITYSNDEGRTWQRARSPATTLLTAVYFSDAQNGWAVGHDAVILATRDGGETWSEQFSAVQEQRPLLDVLFLNTELGFAIGAYGAFYETRDGGKTWAARKITEEDKHLNSFVKVSDEQLLIAGEAGILLFSTDAGKNWQTLAAPYKGSFFGGLSAADGSIVVFGLRGKLFRSVDRGQTWQAISNTSLATLMGGTRLADGALIIAGTAGTILMSRDNGQTFSALPSKNTKALSTVLAGSGNDLLLFGEAGAWTLPGK